MILDEQNRHEYRRFLYTQMEQKRWYDRNARERKFNEGDQVLHVVLLSTTTSKLTAQCQGPYCVKAKVTQVTYEIDMSDKKKRKRVFNVNMLRAWNTPTTMCLMADEVEAEEEIPSWKEDVEEPQINENLTPKQSRDLNELRAEFEDVMSNLPGVTKLVEHKVETGVVRPVKLPPYCLPHAYRVIVKRELKENNSRLSRWSLALQPYQYSVQYRTGKENGNADACTFPVLS